MMKFWSDTFDPIEKKVLKSDLINNEDFASLVCDLDIAPIKVFIPWFLSVSYKEVKNGGKTYIP